MYVCEGGYQRGGGGIGQFVGNSEEGIWRR